MEYVEINGHKIHIFRAGVKDGPRLVFMSGSGTIAPVYDFKILYEKLVSDYRVIVIDKFIFVGITSHIRHDTSQTSRSTDSK